MATITTIRKDWSPNVAMPRAGVIARRPWISVRNMLRLSMATTPKKTKPQTPQQRMASRRERLRAQGLRPVQHWVPDLRNPRVLREIRREAAMLSKHPEDAAIDDWLDLVRDPDDWSWNAATWWSLSRKVTWASRVRESSFRLTN
jgi:antidote-toxin recognition MazE-like antitoxin